MVQPASDPRGTNPRKELVREQLIDIAAQLFDSKGYVQTSINDIARAIGLGRSAVYHYFRNKEEILAALVEAEALTPSHQLKDLMTQTGLTPAERLRRAVVDGITRRLSSGSRFILLARLEAQIPEELGPLYNQGRRDIYDFYVRCIAEGISCGEFREVDPKVAAFAVIGMANWTSRWYSPSGARSPAEIGEIIADMALHGLTARDGVVDRNAGVRDALKGLREQVDLLERTLK
ncbi:TetR/AcrR family transcriptional regulator [Mesorhizobium sp. CAU 1741]|uniref:TetR/AcrR family transcriptional regulator n=1 Tax=Mesorhizobium sp. CAU 1741 TaxID=3140366 RepID=UPI00325C2792